MRGGGLVNDCMKKKDNTTIFNYAKTFINRGVPDFCQYDEWIHWIKECSLILM